MKKNVFFHPFFVFIIVIYRFDYDILHADVNHKVIVYHNYIYIDFIKQF